MFDVKYSHGFLFTVIYIIQISYYRFVRRKSQKQNDRIYSIMWHFRLRNETALHYTSMTHYKEAEPTHRSQDCLKKHFFCGGGEVILISKDSNLLMGNCGCFGPSVPMVTLMQNITIKHSEIWHFPIMLLKSIYLPKDQFCMNSPLIRTSRHL